MAAAPTKKTTTAPEAAATAEPTKDTPAPTAAEEKKDAKSYSELAASLADDVRAIAEGMRDKLNEVTERCAEVNETAPTPEDFQAASGVRRIPMSVDDVNRALSGLVAVAADLARNVAR